MFPWKGASILLFLLCSCLGVAQGKGRYQRHLIFGPALSFKVLGSEDARRAYFIGAQDSRPDPRLTLWGQEADLVREFTIMESVGGGFRQWPVTHAFNYGFSLIGRYWMRLFGHRLFLEAGWGLDYINRLTYDVYGRINSSPLVGIGFPIGDKEVGHYLSLRWKHISNAGTAGNNEGENYAQLVIGIRF